MMSSAHAHYWYHCDNDCGMDTNEFEGWSKKIAKRSAQRNGWKIGKKNLCPKCQVDLKKEKTK